MTKHIELPGHYIRGRAGTYAKVEGAGTDHLDRPVYSLCYLVADEEAEPIEGSKLWTLIELQDAGVEWLAQRPSDVDLRVQEELIARHYRAMPSRLDR
jgi:hypothetical protein